LDFNKSLPHFSKWLFHWAFASVTLTIVSGAVAERIKLETYAILSMFMAVWYILFKFVLFLLFSKKGVPSYCCLVLETYWMVGY